VIVELVDDALVSGDLKACTPGPPLAPTQLVTKRLLFFSTWTLQIQARPSSVRALLSSQLHRSGWPGQRPGFRAVADSAAHLAALVQLDPSTAASSSCTACSTAARTC
jgi:hypothetical protein